MLHETGEFAAALRAAASGLSDASGRSEAALLPLIEKDYWVTTVLSTIVAKHGDIVTFKGGTSLARAWRLTQRLSEDIDLGVEPGNLSISQRDNLFFEIEETVASGLGIGLKRGNRGAGEHLETWVPYATVFPDLIGDLDTRVLVEMGMRTPRTPAQVLSVASLIEEVLYPDGDTPQDLSLPRCDVSTYDFHHTLLDKVFAVTSAANRYIEDRRADRLWRTGRHYYDLAMLSRAPSVAEFLQSPQVTDLMIATDGLSRSAFARTYRPPGGLDFSNTPGLRFPESVEPVLRTAYEKTKALVFGELPSFEEVKRCLGSLADSLPIPETTPQ